MDTGIERRLTTLEVKQAAIVEDLDEIKADVRAIREVLVSARGGWKIIAAGVAAATTIGSLVAAFWQWFQLRP